MKISATNMYVKACLYILNMLAWSLDGQPILLSATLRERCQLYIDSDAELQTGKFNGFFEVPNHIETLIYRYRNFTENVHLITETVLVSQD